MRWKPNYRKSVLLAVALLALALIIAGGWPAFWKWVDPISSQNKNVIFLVVDTARADHLGCYGYGRQTSPHIDALAATSTRYPRSFSSSPWTLPSHASFFTGLFSYEHGAHTHLMKKPNKKRLSGEYRLGDEHNTLAEILSRQGYRTGAVVANVSYLSKRWNLHQGFEMYAVKGKRAGRINAIARKWIDEVKDDPFFLFVNYMDAHRPYNTSPRPGFLPTPAIQDGGELIDKLKGEVMDPVKEDRFPTQLANQVIDQYDTGIANVDERIGGFLAFLRRRKLYDNTMIILTSDHGEFFGEHRLVEHSKDVYQEVLHVPLLIKGFYQDEGEISRDVVSSVDLPGMIARAISDRLEDKAARAFQRLPGTHPILAENYYTRDFDLQNKKWGFRFKRIRAVLFDFPYKFILSSDGNNELYHLDRDPGESKNLLRAEPGLSDKLERELSGMVKPHWEKYRPPPNMDLSETEREQMRKLGYME